MDPSQRVDSEPATKSLKGEKKKNRNSNVGEGKNARASPIVSFHCICPHLVFIKKGIKVEIIKVIVNLKNTT